MRINYMQIRENVRWIHIPSKQETMDKNLKGE